MRRASLAVLAAAALAIAARQDEPPGSSTPPVPRWWKGNTHTHTLWSDGDSPPEIVVDWYREHGYDFLVLTDHNHVQAGERWIGVGEDPTARWSRDDVDALRGRFGDRAVELRDRGGRTQMRLQTLAELQLRFAKPGSFLLIPGEEITCSYRAKTETGFRDHPIHVNAINVADTIPPRGGDSPAHLMNAILRDVREHAAAAGQPVLTHVNHPIENAALTAEDIATLDGDPFFEIHNGLRTCPGQSEDADPSIEDWWDAANTIRAADLERPLLYGLATDDAHDFDGTPEHHAGRAWIHVRSPSLDAVDLIAAMRRGDVYASTGVELEDVRVTHASYVVDVVAREEVRHRVRFYGLRRGDDAAQVLMDTGRDPAVYTWTGDEVWVRAKVITDRPHTNPQHPDEVERAWTQPFRRPADPDAVTPEPDAPSEVPGGDGR